MAIEFLGVRLPEGATVTVDSAPIIYFLEDHPRLAPRFSALFNAAARGDIEVVVSTITLAEVVAGPLRAGNEILAAQYHQALRDSAHWRIAPVTEEVAVLGARIRASRKLRLPDAIQVATAVCTGSIALVTHDIDFKAVREIQVLS